MELSLTKELEKLRSSGHAPDTSRGMAIVYRNVPMILSSKFNVIPGPLDTWEAIGLFTVAFAEAWCKGDPAYRWERL